MADEENPEEFSEEESESSPSEEEAEELSPEELMEETLGEESDPSESDDVEESPGPETGEEEQDPPSQSDNPEDDPEPEEPSESDEEETEDVSEEGPVEESGDAESEGSPEESTPDLEDPDDETEESPDEEPVGETVPEETREGTEGAEGEVDPESDVENIDDVETEEFTGEEEIPEDMEEAKSPEQPEEESEERPAGDVESVEEMTEEGAEEGEETPEEAGDEPGDEDEESEEIEPDTGDPDDVEPADEEDISSEGEEPSPEESEIPAGEEEPVGEAGPEESEEEPDPTAEEETEGEKGEEPPEDADDVEEAPDEVDEGDAGDESDIDDVELEDPGEEDVDEVEDEPKEEESTDVEDEPSAESEDIPEESEEVEPEEEGADAPSESDVEEEPEGMEDVEEDVEDLPEEEADTEESAGEEQAEEPGEVEAGEEEGKGSIKDMLEEESERAREEEEAEEEAEEEELPEGYITVEQLPEEEEFEFPGWAKYSGYSILGLLFLYFCWSYLALPLWENYHVTQVQESIESGNFNSAESYVDRALFLNGFLVHNPDPFLADFLGDLLRNNRFQQFQDAHDRFRGTDLYGPYARQMYAQFLLNRGRWEEAISVAEELQFSPETRGMGYLFHGKASLMVGNLSDARSGLARATNWLGDHPEVDRLQRDVLIAQENYEQARRVASELRNKLAEEDDLSPRVRDFVQLARINANLNRHRVAEEMLSQALEVNPRDRTALRELGLRYLLQERWNLAEPLIRGRRSQEPYRVMYPLDAFGWWASAELNLSQDRVVESIPLLERAMSLNPRDPEVHRVFGKLHLGSLDEPNQAANHFEEARSLGLQRLRFIETLAVAYYQSGQYERAVEQYELLRDRIEGDRLKIMYNLGSAHLGAGHYDRAENLLSNAFEEGYVNESIYNQRGLLRELRGEGEEAFRDAGAMYFQGKEWATRNQVQVKLLQSNLDRSLEARPPEPLEEWMAPLDRSIEIPYWQQLDPETSLGDL